MSLKHALSSTSMRWHQRAVVRKWTDIDSSDAPFLVTVASGSDADEASSRIAARVHIGGTPDVQTVSLRVVARVNDDQLTTVQDIEVRFDFTRPDPPTDVELADLLRGWGVEVALGYIRGALAEASSSVGLPALVLDPLYALSDADVDSIIASARAASTIAEP